jgi:hypothetical protein
MNRGYSLVGVIKPSEHAQLIWLKRLYPPTGRIGASVIRCFFWRLAMPNRRWIFLLLLVVGIGAIAAGTWYYRSKCHGVDACAAAAAESHERDTPGEPQ